MKRQGKGPAHSAMRRSRQLQETKHAKQRTCSLQVATPPPSIGQVPLSIATACGCAHVCVLYVCACTRARRLRRVLQGLAS